MRHYDIRLIGMEAPDGEIDADDLVAIVAAMKKLTRQLMREALEQPGRGRPSGLVEGLSRTRVAVGSGSTTLAFTVGDPSTLEIDPIADDVDARFRDLVSGFESEDGPRNVSETVAGTAAELARAVINAAPMAEISIGDLAAVRVHRDAVHPEGWSPRTRSPSTVRTLTGKLEMADLHSSTFRIRDVVGNTVDLIEVEDPETITPMLGIDVEATGSFSAAAGAGKNRMSAPKIVPAVGVLERLGLADLPLVETLRQRARSAPQPEPLDMTDEEIDSFMAAISE